MSLLLEYSKKTPNLKPQTPEQNVKEEDPFSLAERLAPEYGVDPQLARKMLKTESGGNPRATSKKGAMGLMQLMPTTAREMGVKDPYHPEQNVRGALGYLKKMYDRFGDWELAVAAYNAGPGNVEKYGGVPPFPETKDYVRKLFPRPFEEFREYPWVARALDTGSMMHIKNPDGSVSTVKTITYGVDGKYYVAPTIRQRGDELVELTPAEAIAFAMDKKDAVPFNSQEKADEFAQSFSQWMDKSVKKEGPQKRTLTDFLPEKEEDRYAQINIDELPRPVLEAIIDVNFSPSASEYLKTQISYKAPSEAMRDLLLQKGGIEPVDGPIDTILLWGMPGAGPFLKAVMSKQTMGWLARFGISAGIGGITEGAIAPLEETGFTEEHPYLTLVAGLGIPLVITHKLRQHLMQYGLEGLLVPLKSQRGSISLPSGPSLGEKAWSKVAPIGRKITDYPIIPQRMERLTDYLGGRSVREFILPATERMEKIGVADPRLAFKKAHRGRAKMGSLVNREFEPLLKSLTPEERLDFVQWMKSGKTFEDWALRPGKNVKWIAPTSKEKVLKFEKLRGQMLGSMERYDKKYGLYLEEKFNERVSKFFEGFDDPALKVIRQKLGMLEKPDVVSRGVFQGSRNFKRNQKLLDAVIDDPLIEDKVRKTAIELYDMPSKTPIEIYHSYANATHKTLALKIKASPWSSVTYKSGYVEGKGLLKGVYVPKEINQGMQELTYMRRHMNEMFQRYFLNPWKMVRIVMRFPTQFRNFFGNLAMNDMFGEHALQWYSPRGVSVYGRAAKDLWSGGKYSKELMDLTGLDTHTFVGSEVAQWFAPKLHDRNMLDALLNGFNVVAKPFAQLYQFNEKWAKTAKYMWNREMGMKARDAAEDAMKATFDYENVSVFTKRMRESLMPFFTWKSKIWGMMPEAVVKHPLRVGKYLTVPAGITAYALHRLNLTEEEWKDVKGVMPHYVKDGYLMLLPFRDAKGRLQFMDMTWMIPGIGDTYELYAGAKSLVGESDRPIPAAIASIVQNPIANIWAELASNTSMGTGLPIYNEWEPGYMQLARMLYHPMKQIMPTWFIGGTDFNTMARAALVQGKDDYTLGQALAGQVGLKAQPVKEQTWRRGKAIEKVMQKKDIQRSLRREIKKAGKEGSLGPLYPSKKDVAKKYKKKMKDWIEREE